MGPKTSNKTMADWRHLGAGHLQAKQQAFEALQESLPAQPEQPAARGVRAEAAEAPRSEVSTLTADCGAPEWVRHI